MHTSNFKSYQAGSYSLLFVCFFFLFCFSSLHEVEAQDAQAQQSEAVQEAVEEATNPAQQVPDEIPVDPQSVANGSSLFGQHCTVCHMVEKQLIGPALASVHNRRPIPWLLQFIKNSQYVINETDDEYAQHLFSEYNEVLMPQFNFLSNEDIYDILSYIKSESASPTTAGGVNGVDEETVTRPQDEYADPDGEDTYTQEAQNNGIVPNSVTGTSIVLLIVFGLSLIAVVVSLVFIIKGMKKRKIKEKA
ncbi:c-type cytochrome [Catalinimonas niigatensis]|uniref:c-type cytochrome n=1 Tax=Catalinimonas niigatensis TaxID=1397264 RepID=UPI002665B773|nr:cytochrome c [Catalinimonas niigatensis]WPP49889.1 cytochrome c [Catalinimonas niigatensis]